MESSNSFYFYAIVIPARLSGDISHVCWIAIIPQLKISYPFGYYPVLIARGYLMGSAGDLLLRTQTVSGGIRSVSIPLPEAFVKPKIYIDSQLSSHVQ